MINFETILAQNPEVVSEKAPEAVSNIKEWFGHYRPDHFDQSVLEDMRQRLSRRGVSLYSFQQNYLPVLYEIMQISVEMGKRKTLPPLFSYEVYCLTLAHGTSAPWTAPRLSSMSRSTWHRPGQNPAFSIRAGFYI